MSIEEFTPPIPTREDREELVNQLMASWPAQAERDAVRLRISTEIERFVTGEGASLPFRARNGIAWVTVAPRSAGLRQEMEMLQAWVVPSYAWVDSHQPYVTPGEASGGLASALLRTSPAGYVRWWCTTADMPLVAERLRTMRTLAARRPAHFRERVPSLLELRQQFRTALLTGARDAAEATIHAIDHYQLDSAVNTQMMRVRLLDQFREFATIVDDPAVERLLSLRLPPAVRTALIRAHVTVFVDTQDTVDHEGAAVAFRKHVYPRVGGMLALARPTDGPEVARALAYQAWISQDGDAARALLPVADPATRQLLQGVVDATSARAAERDVSDAFQEALRRGDLQALQDLAPSLLARIADAGSRTAPGVLEALADSLEVRPNPSLAASLEQVTSTSFAPTVPQSWTEVLDRVRSGDLESAERFLRLDDGDRPNPEHLSATEREAAIATLEELLTNPTFSSDARGRWVADVALPAFVDDFAGDPQFPRAEQMPLYLQLLRLWADYKRGSAYVPDAQLTVLLASTVLRQSSGNEAEVSTLLVDWWRARPHRVALPFLLEAIELILEYTGEQNAAQQLWLDGASLVARGPSLLSPGERLVWGRLGQLAGFDADAVAEVLPTPSTPDIGGEDALTNVGWRKVAIVSLHRRPAEEAARVLVGRTGASVIVVDETTPGPMTRSAQSADIILVVWAATKHAVFQAFDSRRDRIVYVAGTGAASIVSACEKSAQRETNAATA